MLATPYRLVRGSLTLMNTKNGQMNANSSSITQRRQLFSASKYHQVPLIIKPLSSFDLLNSITSLSIRSSYHTVADNDIKFDLPLKPKKPAIPWLLFLSERKEEVMRQNPGINAPRLCALLSKEWKTIDRTEYERIYEKNRSEFVTETKRYLESLTPEQQKYLQLRTVLLREENAVKAIKRMKPPKLPRTAQNLYISARMKHPDIQERLKNTRSHILIKELSEEYRECSPEEKKIWDKRKLDDRTRFGREFLDWYEKIINDRDLSATVKTMVEKMHNRFSNLNYI